MSFGTKHWRLWSPFVVLLWAVVTVVFAGTAQAVDSHGTDKQSSVVTAGSDAASPQAPPTSTSPPPPDHPTGPPTSGGGGDHPVGRPAPAPVTPQPISTADANTGGANGQCPGGPYCSTSDGTASGNGNGGGQATGKACAGCVGKADNKNPHGQMPNATDHNAGYECDTNHGIARGNPAHSGCLQAPPEVCPTEPCVPVPPCPTEPCVPLPPCPAGTCVSPPIVSAAAPSATVTVSPPVRGLPNTGAPAGLVWLALTATGSILAGSALLLRRGGRVPLART